VDIIQVKYMKNKKIIIYAVVAALVLGLGIFIGIMLSKGSDKEDSADNTKLVIDNPELLKKIEFTSDEYAQYLELKSSLNGLEK
jgi:hypothetical protein